MRPNLFRSKSGFQKCTFLGVAFGIGILLGAVDSWATPTGNKPGSICAATSDSCDTTYKSFAPYELPFRLPVKLKDNTPFRSVEFYAVELRRFKTNSTNGCDAGEWTQAVEKERLLAQKFFGKVKVFADHQCPDMGAVTYAVNGKFSSGIFMAVYGGKTRTEAEKLLPRAKKRFPQAKVQRMQVSFEKIMQ